MRQVDTILGKSCMIGKKEATIIGQISWNNKIQYVWVDIYTDVVEFGKVKLI